MKSIPSDLFRIGGRAIILPWFLFGSLCFASCKPDPPEDPSCTPENPATPSTHLAVVWIQKFHAGGEPEYFNDPLFWGNYLVVSNNMSYPGTEMGIRMLDKATGENHPAWNREPGGIVDPGDFQLRVYPVCTVRLHGRASPTLNCHKQILFSTLHVRPMMKHPRLSGLICERGLPPVAPWRYSFLFT